MRIIEIFLSLSLSRAAGLKKGSGCRVGLARAGLAGHYGVGAVGQPGQAQQVMPVAGAGSVQLWWLLPGRCSQRCKQSFRSSPAILDPGSSLGC